MSTTSNSSGSVYYDSCTGTGCTSPGTSIYHKRSSSHRLSHPCKHKRVRKRRSSDSRNCSCDKRHKSRKGSIDDCKCRSTKKEFVLRARRCRRKQTCLQKLIYCCCQTFCCCCPCAKKMRKYQEYGDESKTQSKGDGKLGGKGAGLKGDDAKGKKGGKDGKDGKGNDGKGEQNKDGKVGGALDGQLSKSAQGKDGKNADGTAMDGKGGKLTDSKSGDKDGIDGKSGGKGGGKDGIDGKSGGKDGIDSKSGVKDGIDSKTGDKDGADGKGKDGKSKDGARRRVRERDGKGKGLDDDEDEDDDKDVDERDSKNVKFRGCRQLDSGPVQIGSSCGGPRVERERFICPNSSLLDVRSRGSCFQTSRSIELKSQTLETKDSAPMSQFGVDSQYGRKPCDVMAPSKSKTSERSGPAIASTCAADCTGRPQGGKLRDMDQLKENEQSCSNVVKLLWKKSQSNLPQCSAIREIPYPPTFGMSRATSVTPLANGAVRLALPPFLRSARPGASETLRARSTTIHRPAVQPRSSSAGANAYGQNSSSSRGQAGGPNSNASGTGAGNASGTGPGNASGKGNASGASTHTRCPNPRNPCSAQNNPCLSTNPPTWHHSCPLAIDKKK